MDHYVHSRHSGEFLDYREVKVSRVERVKASKLKDLSVELRQHPVYRLVGPTNLRLQWRTMSAQTSVTSSQKIGVSVRNEEIRKGAAPLLANAPGCERSPVLKRLR